jgi:diadenosine tetraphosphate (Ap4A) HIT family hydrolase
MNCVFCELPEIKNRIILETELVKVFPTNIPVVPGHVLVVPVRHVETLESLTGQEWVALREVLEQTKQALSRAYGAVGFNIAWNEKEIAGQSVPHFHMHVLPRKEGDTGITEYEPRKFLYRPGSRAQTSEEELTQVAAEIKKYLL